MTSEPNRSDTEATAAVELSSSAPAGPSLAVRAVGSTAWMMTSQALQMVLGMGFFALSSRWLSPADYGLIAMAATVSSFLGVIGDAGVGYTIVRLPKIDATIEATAFWLGIAGAGVLSIGTAVAAPLLARFYRNDMLIPLSLGLATTFLLSAPGRVSSAKLSRQLRFRAYTIVTAIANIASSAVALVLAARGFGPWSLVVQAALGCALQSVMVMVVSPVRLKPTLFSRTLARELASFGSQLSGFSLATTVGRSLDNIMAGRLLGSSAVGFMTMGMKLIYLPAEKLCGATFAVFLPTTVEINNIPQQARAFQTAARVLLILVGPFALGAAAVAPEIIALLPAKWAGLAPLILAYAVTCLVLPINYLSLAILIAFGRERILLRMSIALIPVCWLGAVIGALSGSPLGIVCAWSFGIVVGTGISFWFVWRQLKLTREFWAKMVAPLAASLVMALVVRAVLYVTGLSGSRTGFMVGTSVGVALYGVLVWATMRADASRVLSLFRQALAGRRSR